jgi:hypothetical protein
VNVLGLAISQKDLIPVEEQQPATVTQPNREKSEFGDSLEVLKVRRIDTDS